MTYALVRPVRLDLEAFARATATHPELIRRLVALGLVEADRDAAGLAERQMTLEVSEDARGLIAQQGFDPVYGARPLRRFIAHEVETRIGRALLAGDIRDGAVIRVGLADGELSVTYENRQAAENAS